MFAVCLLYNETSFWERLVGIEYFNIEVNIKT